MAGSDERAGRGEGDGVDALARELDQPGRGGTGEVDQIELAVPAGGGGPLLVGCHGNGGELGAQREAAGFLAGGEVPEDEEAVIADGKGGATVTGDGDAADRAFVADQAGGGGPSLRVPEHDAVVEAAADHEAWACGQRADSAAVASQLRSCRCDQQQEEEGRQPQGCYSAGARFASTSSAQIEWCSRAQFRSTRPEPMASKAPSMPSVPI